MKKFCGSSVDSVRSRKLGAGDPLCSGDKFGPSNNPFELELSSADNKLTSPNMSSSGSLGFGVSSAKLAPSVAYSVMKIYI